MPARSTSDDAAERRRSTEPTGSAEPAPPADTPEPAAGTETPAAAGGSTSTGGDPAAPAPPEAGTAEEPASGVPEAGSLGDRPAATGTGPGNRGCERAAGSKGAPGYPARTPSPKATPRWRQVAYPPGVLPAAGTAGLAAAATVPLDRPGIGWLLAGIAAAGAVGVIHHRAHRSAKRTGEELAGAGRNRERLWWTAAALALLAVGTFRAAGWLFVLCVAAAAVAGSLAVVGRRSAEGVWRDATAVPAAAFGALAWVYAAQGGLRDGAGARRRRLGVSVAVTLILLAVFVPLLTGADALFAAFVDGLVPRMDGTTATRWVVVFALAGTGSLSAMYLLAATPAPAGAHPKVPPRTLTRPEWGLPVGALTVLFALFVGTQLVALFGGDDYVQRTAGLTYAEYARGGFWQLSAVTVLTLAVILPVLHRAVRDSAADRLWLRVLLCAISGLTLVIIASALGRMWTYQQAYGFTVLRLLVGTCELWLGIVYVLVMIAVLRLEATWLPRSALGTAVAALLTLAVLNPEALVASENIDRWQRGKELDVAYLAGLSVDIVPALDRLPESIRVDLHNRLTRRLDEDTWNSWNLGRARARG
ncbi:DUF4153 domain-containing protein [Nocardia sp. X0981]